MRVEKAERSHVADGFREGAEPVELDGEALEVHEVEADVRW